MANNNEDHDEDAEIGEDGSPTFKVTIEDCTRWASRLQRMAKTLEGRETTTDNTDGIKMFYTASVLIQRLALEIQQDALFAGIPVPMFGPGTIGEA